MMVGVRGGVMSFFLAVQNICILINSYTRKQFTIFLLHLTARGIRIWMLAIEFSKKFP